MNCKKTIAVEAHRNELNQNESKIKMNKKRRQNDEKWMDWKL